MSIRLELDGQTVVEFEEENILLGSDPGCTIPFPAGNGLAPKHAVIRKIAGRWIVEVRGGDSIQIGDQPPSRMHWLNPGDVIRLTESGPFIQFEPPQKPAKPTRRSSAEIPVQPKPILRPKSEELNTLQLSKPKTVALPPIEGAVELGEIKPKSVPSVKAIPSTKPAIKPVEFAEADAPETRPLPAIAKPSPWLGNTASAAVAAQQHRGRRRFWMQAGGAAVLVLVGAVFWLSGARRVPPDIDPAPSTVPPTAAAPAPNQPLVAAPLSVPAEQSLPSEMITAAQKPQPSPAAPNPVESTTQTIIANPKPAVAKATTKSPSATLVAVRDGVYSVLAKLPDSDEYYRLGTAWAASKRSLVTSGAVALAVESLVKDGASIVVVQPFQELPIPIKASRMHPAFSHAIKIAAAAKARMSDSATAAAKGSDEQIEPPADQLAKAHANQARFDLGVLDIEAGHRLPMSLKMETGDLPDVSKADYLLVGFPFAEAQYQTDGVHKTGDAKERVATKNSAAKNDSDLALTMKFTADVAEEIWSGSPVFDRSQRVIGVYSRPALPEQQNESPQKRRHAIVWLGRLREFASEFE